MKLFWIDWISIIVIIAGFLYLTIQAIFGARHKEIIDDHKGDE